MARFSSLRFHLLIIAILAFAAALFVQPGAFGNEDNPTFSEAGLSPGTVQVTVHAGSYEIRPTARGDEVSLAEFGRLHKPGVPELPSRIVPVAIPPGARVTELRVEAGRAMELPGTYRVPPAPSPRIISGEDLCFSEREARIYDANFASVYESGRAFPQSLAEFVGHAGYRKYNLADIRVTPFVYHPENGSLVFHPEITLHVEYEFPDGALTARPMSDNIASTEATAREFIANYDDAQTWYAETGIDPTTVPTLVIITLDNLVPEIQPLVTWERAKGQRVRVVTTSWIQQNIVGVDLEQKIRNLLREKYPSSRWAITDVVLVGHWPEVPMRQTAKDVGFGAPRSDFYFAELSLPDSASWDSDGDGKYGENSDKFDYYSEVNVGRIPVNNANDVRNICGKSVGYEQNTDPSYKKNILLLGAYFWEDTDTAELMEYISNIELHPWLSSWSMTKMYEQNNEYWSGYTCDVPLAHSNVMSEWPVGKYSVVTWAGHGSPVSAHVYGLSGQAFISKADCWNLDDSHPAIIFADSCSNSDTTEDNLGMMMLRKGGVGFLGATMVAFGSGGWTQPTDGSTQTLAYYFTSFVTSGAYTMGEAHQRALRMMYLNDLWYYKKFETLEWGALFGHPNIQLRTLGVPRYVVTP